ncbi:hypothetical protein PILCRDRAFT_190655 [Piloderma croceum F 1598]|uniref:Uncharacterized protein n=1 Tax=Piloderma croceum (strain F 1598) TaxID=765440 RepID=A0A0C3BSN7_PILCF|nr:hypothetical protein PILCRDRAFT_190655 [Piloderma croceum F 1598]
MLASRGLSFVTLRLRSPHPPLLSQFSLPAYTANLQNVNVRFALISRKKHERDFSSYGTMLSTSTNIWKTRQVWFEETPRQPIRLLEQPSQPTYRNDNVGFMLSHEVNFTREYPYYSQHGFKIHSRQELVAISLIALVARKTIVCCNQIRVICPGSEVIWGIASDVRLTFASIHSYVIIDEHLSGELHRRQVDRCIRAGVVSVRVCTLVRAITHMVYLDDRPMRQHH